METLGPLLSLIGIIALYVVGFFILVKIAVIVVTLPKKVSRLEERISNLEKGKK